MERLARGFRERDYMILGYARASTEQQSLDAQLEALRTSAVERMFLRKISGLKQTRREFACLIDKLCAGHVIVVAKYNRLSRAFRENFAVLEEVRAKEAGVRSFAEDIDTTTSAGRVVFHVFAPIVRFEREPISERTRKGLVAARKAGRLGGWPPALSSQQLQEACCLRDEEDQRIKEITRLFKVSPNTVWRA